MLSSSTACEHEPIEQYLYASFDFQLDLKMKITETSVFYNFLRNISS